MVTHRVKKTILWSIFGVIAVIYLFYGLSRHSKVWKRQPTPADNRQTVDKSRCQIPLLNPFDPSIMHFFKGPANFDLECQAPQPLVFLDELGKLRITANKSTLKRYGSADCFYKTIQRNGDDSFELSKLHYFKNMVSVTSEFIAVECIDRKKAVVFTDYSPFIIRKRNVEERVLKNLKKNVVKDKLRVVLLGLDSMSRSQFLRHMKRTSKFIREKLQFAELFAYNKVGSYTFPNILAFLTGMTEEESATDMAITYADVLPWIWKEFEKAGYRTLYAADTPYISIFNFGRKGFKEKPTDYYWRPFGLAIENSPLIIDGQRGCYNQRPETKVILKWVEDFLDTFPHDPLFAFSFHTRLSHGSLLEPRYQDKPIVDFLRSLDTKGHFNNTIIIFFGDHGFRYGDFRTTYVGRMEDKLPFAFLLLPHWFSSRYPKLYQNLQINQHRLITPFDMFATLRTILNLSDSVHTLNQNERSISLLSSEIPENRTCKTAGIEPQFCACVQRQRADLKDARVLAAAQEMVRTLNFLTSAARHLCAELELDNVLDASVQNVITGDDGSGGETNVYDFLVTVEVKPSKGMFEGTVWYSSAKDTYAVDQHIERINLYGNQSSCIDDSKLKPFCYCLTA